MQCYCGAHTDLIDIGESVSNCKHVEDLLNGLTDPQLRISKEHILGDQTKYGSFVATHQYVNTIHVNLAAQDNNDHIISDTEGESGPGSRYDQGR